MGSLAIAREGMAIASACAQGKDAISSRCYSPFRLRNVGMGVFFDVIAYTANAVAYLGESWEAFGRWC